MVLYLAYHRVTELQDSRPLGNVMHVDVHFGGDLPHKSDLLSTECSSVSESDYSVHNTLLK